VTRRLHLCRYFGGNERAAQPFSAERPREIEDVFALEWLHEQA